ncbi:MAG: MFS transporter [Candidatus Bipolaricaulia bacterium]
MQNLDTRVAVLGIARMADALSNSFLIVVLPLFVASGTVEHVAFGLTEAMVTGLILSVFGLFNSSLQPFAGRLSDRFGKRKAFILLGLVILAVCNFSFSLAESYLALLGIRAVQGVTVAITITASIALVNEYSTAGQRGSNMGIFNSFRMIGFGSGPLFAGLVLAGGPYTLPVLGGLEISGFNAAFYIAALAALTSVGLVSLFVSDPVETQPTRRRVAIAVRSARPDRWLDPIFTLGVASFTMAAGISVLSTIEPQINARLGQGPTMFGLQFAAFIGANALFQPLTGKLSDRFGRRTFILIGMAFLVPTTFVQGLIADSWLLVAARFAQGISGALVFAPALALAGDLTQRGQSGAQLSVLTMSFGFGIAAGPLSSGFLIELGYLAPFAFGAVMAVFGWALVYTQVDNPSTEPTVAASAPPPSIQTQTARSPDSD